MTTINVGQYLLKRLKEVGIDTIFGVPGDYNLSLMDLIEDDDEITWGNNANELNASYAADGYARVKGIGALVTTSGVGELSAINGIAGSYSERVPVIHIVGSSKLHYQKEGALLHHTLGNGDFSAFIEMAGKVTCAYTRLDKNNALAEIDRVIEQSYIQKLPGYINVPIDIVDFNVVVDSKPLNLKSPKCSEKIQNAAMNTITNEIFKASHPIIVVDFLVDRFQSIEEVRAFVKKSGFPTFITPMAKGIIPESFSNYVGCYNGSSSSLDVLKMVEKADLVIDIGPLKYEMNTGRFTSELSKRKYLIINPNNTVSLNMTFDNLGMKQLLPHLTLKLPNYDRNFGSPRVRPVPDVKAKAEMTQNYLWSKFKTIVDSDSIVLFDTGTIMPQVPALDSQEGVMFICQSNWCSIGYSVGAALGAALANRKRRVYLFVGDGAFQMGAQELAVYLHHGITPVIFIINNDGYLIEKMLRGPYKEYNNFQMWEYSKSFDYFGGHLRRNTKNKTHSKIGLETKIFTCSEFDKAIVQVKKEKEKIHLLEVITPQFDIPSELEITIASLKTR